MQAHLEAGEKLLEYCVLCPMQNFKYISFHFQFASLHKKQNTTTEAVFHLLKGLKILPVLWIIRDSNNPNSLAFYANTEFNDLTVCTLKLKPLEYKIKHTCLFLISLLYLQGVQTNQIYQLADICQELRNHVHEFVHHSHQKIYLKEVFSAVLTFPSRTYLFKVRLKNTKRIYEICLKLTINTPERR